MLDDFGLGLTTYSTWTGGREGLVIAEASLWHVVRIQATAIRCQADVDRHQAKAGSRCIGAPQDTASPAAVGHLRVGVWVAANPMDSNVEPVLISAM